MFLLAVRAVFHGWKTFAIRLHGGMAMEVDEGSPFDFVGHGHFGFG